VIRTVILTLAASAALAQTCQTLDLNKRTNAGEIAAKLNKITDKTSVIAAGPSLLLVCSDDDTLKAIAAAVPGLAHSDDAIQPDSHSVRLFFNRQATNVAAALDGVYKDISVKAVGDDLLVFGASQLEDEPSIRELKRWVAALDTPRPQVTLNAWSVQASSPNEEDVKQVAENVRTVVFAYNEELRKALENGLYYLDSKRYEIRTYSAPWFVSYVLNRFVKGNPSNVGKLAMPPDDKCGDKAYCLGYGEAFVRPSPSLSVLIGILAGAKNPVHDHVEAFVNRLEGKGDAKSDASKTGAGTCGAGDEAEYNANPADFPQYKPPVFNCFRSQLRESLQGAKLALLRTAMADYLFQYKMALQYPHDFDIYDFSASAQRLDAQFDPLLIAFNQDMVVFLRHLQQVVSCNPNCKGTDLQFASNGIVTVTTLSGQQGSVNTGTQSAFASTPPPLVQDFLNNLSKSTSTPGLLTSNLPANAAQSLAAFLNSSQPSRVTLGRDLNLTVTPVTLPGASSAELNVTLEAKDDGDASPVANGTPQNDTTDRVTNHKVSTTIRVDTLRLFEVSTFTARLSHGRDPIPLLPPFVELPYIGSFLKVKRRPASAYHQSFAIVSATILPTAADLLNGLRYRADHIVDKSDSEREIWTLSEDVRHNLFQDVVKFHRQMLNCIAREAVSEPNPEPPAECSALR